MNKKKASNYDLILDDIKRELQLGYLTDYVWFYNSRRCGRHIFPDEQEFRRMPDDCVCFIPVDRTLAKCWPNFAAINRKKITAAEALASVEIAAKVLTGR